MHDLASETNVIDPRVVESPEMLGKTCACCARILAYKFFDKDSSCRDGRRDQCIECATAPRLSTDEHTWRLREMNYNSHAIKRQRFEHQEDYQNAAARMGRRMHHSELILRLRKLLPGLLIMDGNFAGELAMFRTFGQPQPRLEGRSFEYLGFMPTGVMPEYSIYHFDARNVPDREEQRGWRTVLLKFVNNGMLTEEQVNRYFGEPTGIGSTVYRRQLWKYRNRSAAA